MVSTITVLLGRDKKLGKSSILMYTTEDGITKVEVTFDNDTVWLSLDQIAELFQKNKSTISRHIKNIFSEGELLLEATVAKFATVKKKGIELLNDRLISIILT